MICSVLRDASGSLDITQIQAKSFEEFCKFIQDHAGINDQITYSFAQCSTQPYKRLLEDKKYLPLLQLLYQARDPQQLVSLSVAEAELLLKEFQRDLIEIDAEAFARNYFSSNSGRQRLSLLLRDKALSHDQKCDLVKEITRVAKEQNLLEEFWDYSISSQISLCNYWNISVTATELERATQGVLEVLGSADGAEKHLRKHEENLEAKAKDATRVDEGDKSWTINPEKIRYMKEMAEQSQKKPGAIFQAAGHLAKLWLMAADRRNWGTSISEDPSAVRAYLLKGCENLLEQLDQEGENWSQADFELFQNKLQEFIHGAVYLEGPSKYLWVKHKLVGAGLENILGEMPIPVRAPFDQIVQLSDTWKHTLNMGESLLLKVPELQNNDPKLAQQINSLIQGLEQARHGLWYGYKQHKALSQGISQVANLFGDGDIQDIQAAQRELKHFITQLSKARTQAEVQQVGEQLFESLKEGGSFYRGLQAAEMNGSEQILGFGQTIAICAGLGIVTRGVGAVVRVGAAFARAAGVLRAAGSGAEALQVARTVQAVARTAEVASVGERMANGFIMGAKTITAENAIAVATGEVRQGNETVASWAKDAAATGISMMVTGALPVSKGAAHTNPLKGVVKRYVSGFKGVGHFVVDTGVDIRPLA